MTTELQETRQQAPALTVDQAALGRERLTHLLPLLRECPQARGEAESMLPALTAPADPVWLMGRAAALLSPYYEKNISQGIREMDAEDWAVALGEFPQWAVQNAVRWWKSADNPKRAKRPLEGDIAARVRVEMDAINAAKIHLKRQIVRKPFQVVDDQITDEQRDETQRIVAEFAARAAGGAK